MTRTVLVCPRCHGTLRWSPDSAVCEGCGRRYAVESGIVDLRGEAADEQKRQQAMHFDVDVDHEWEIERPWSGPCLHRSLLAEKFRRSLAGLSALPAGSTAVVVCGGSGMDAEFLVRRGFRVITTDISPGAARRAAERARRHGFNVLSVVADVEQLPMRDRSIDLAYVHDGLHHIERPFAGLTEMSRVAAAAVSITEPARANLTRAAIRFGLAQSVESAGNVVERLSLGTVTSALERAQFHVVLAQRYGMFYRHQPGPFVRFLSFPGLCVGAAAALRAANAAGGRLGNKLTVQAVRR